jgi:diguanylate cyclase (GGDEF)-like protein
LVLVSFFAIAGLTASGQAALVTADSSTTILNATVNADASAVGNLTSLYLRQSDLSSPVGLTAARQAALTAGLHSLTKQGGILHAALLDPRGIVLASDDGAGVGGFAPRNADWEKALAGGATAAIVPRSEAGALELLPTEAVLREYLPITLSVGGQVYAVVVVWHDAAPILAHLDQIRLRVVLITAAAALLSALLLFFVFRAAQQRLSRQTLQLLEAARLDPLTETLNHGALVKVLTTRIEAAQTRHQEFALALLDLDSFGLLNNTYGHPAGDLVLTEVVRLLSEGVPATATFGRYGPDEFLIIGALDEAPALTDAVERLQTTMSKLSLQFQDSESLPVSFSGGLGFYPANGRSVTTLLSTLAVTLEEAKSSGGDSIRVAEAGGPLSGYAKSFNILEGLVIAVDTKDHYTRRHSEDVASYADFLAGRQNLDAGTCRAIKRAGVLHDVGKIGIPDAILRKPGRLSDEEYEILKQHVALGDAIVRDLPDLAIISAGIRYHHERWDGAGYLAGLAGEEIPLVARILAVADAFSAITTTRPYRKALSFEEALRRLEEAAGSQLDARLVESFVTGMREDADAPRPDELVLVHAEQLLALPDRQAA